MIPYYSPNLSLKTVVTSGFISHPRNKLENYFRKYTGKKYITITNSCRTALYLAYKSLSIHGEVITSPLTCKAAIDPIIESGNKPSYIDINPNSLNMDVKNIESNINDNTIAIQAIHFGGVACKIDKIREIANRNNLLLIEDCAQGFGAEYKDVKAGSLGDISCFSLIKNTYGIGGGILATDNYEIFKRSNALLKQESSSPLILSIYRIIRNIIKSKMKFRLFNIIYHLLMKIRYKKIDYSSLKNIIKSPNKLDLKINYLQLINSEKINDIRINKAENIISKLQNFDLMHNYYFSESRKNVYTKLYIYSKRFSSKNDIEYLNRLGIEAKHLAQKFKCYYQPKLTSDKSLLNFHKIHDHIISIPLFEQMTRSSENRIISILNKV